MCSIRLVEGFDSGPGPCTSLLDLMGLVVRTMLSGTEAKCCLVAEAMALGMLQLLGQRNEGAAAAGDTGSHSSSGNVAPGNPGNSSTGGSSSSSSSSSVYRGKRAWLQSPFALVRVLEKSGQHSLAHLLVKYSKEDELDTSLKQVPRLSMSPQWGHREDMAAVLRGLPLCRCQHACCRPGTVRMPMHSV
jgi:hypothetical protein